ncbi:response regulator [Cohnella sp. GbtcB17]|uniref:response regulator n=1 Tax=Cohnella sp. GbtcB17 TaxID=2824762 RepID=UPI001C30997C|nr:response regulator [Cohnella sp. GbtcB17]
MNRLLIVDDVAIIVDSLFELMDELPGLELECYKAYSAPEALALLGRIRIDIVLTDIKMPEMDGLELLDQIRRRWPRCKVIFLTSYNEFEYAKRAIASGGFDYLLKTEDDDKIVGAVRRAAEALREEEKMAHAIEDARRQLETYRPTLQREFFRELLQGRWTEEERLAERLEELGSPLAADEPLHLLIGRIDERPPDERYADRTLLPLSVQRIVAEMAGDRLTHFALSYDSFRIVWFVQQKGEGGIQPFLAETLASVQTACRRTLQATVSFMLAGQETAWRDAADAFRRLSARMGRGMGLRPGALLIETQAGVDAAVPESGAGEVRPRFRFDGLAELSALLDNNRRDLFFPALRELAAAASEAGAEERTALRLGLRALLLAYDAGDEDRQPGGSFANLDEPGWEEELADFAEQATRLFERRRQGQAERESEVLATIHRHIDDHLGDDISLNRLADLVQLHPSYLSRLYKELTGRGLYDYISERRLAAARKYLRQSSLKVHEIAAALGYNSSFAFARFFKSQTGVTPQEYRQFPDGSSCKQ